MGKTRISVHFAYLHQRDFDSIFVLDGSNILTVIEGFARVLSRVTKHTDGDPTGAIGTSRDREAAQKALNWFCLEGNKKWLLVFDNVDTQAFGKGVNEGNSYRISDWFPSASWGSVLLTTRLTDLSHLGRETRVEKMDLKQSQQLFSNVVRHSSSRYHGLGAAQLGMESGMNGE